EVDHLAEGVGHLVSTIAEAEQPHLAVADLVETRSRQRKDRLAELHSKLAGSLRDRAGLNLFYPVDDREPKRTAAAVQPAEQQHGRHARAGSGRAFGDAPRPLLLLQLDAADL